MNTFNFKESKIMIVDDNISNIELLEMILEESGFDNIKSINDSLLVLEICKSFKPDLILLDLMMPKKNGFEVMEELKSIISPNTYLPILVLTADMSAESKKKALSVGAKDFLSKPFDLTEIILRIKNLLETRYLYQLLEDQNKNLKFLVQERTREIENAYNEIKISKEQLEVLDNAKLEFLKLISHEIRTPLNGIVGFTEILKTKINSPELIGYLNYLEISAERLSKFSLQALLITQLNSKKYELDKVDIILTELLENSKNNIKDKIKKKNIQIVFIKNDDLTTLKADYKLIEISFESILDNAVKFSNINDKVVIRTYIEGNKKIIEFIDSGIGFSQAALNNLFRLFGIGNKHVDENTGLNLALVKLIMDAHGGEIKVFNNEVGSTVQLIFNIE